jgi:hypothetical protein
LAAHQFQPAQTATTVKVHGGKAEVANLDEAIAVVKTWPGDAKLELRPIVEMAGVDNVPSALTAARR